MRKTKCGWKIANDTMQMIKSLWGEINSRCFLKVLFVNKPSHLIALRSLEVQYFQSQTGQNILKSVQSKPWSNNNRLDFYRPTPFFLHYIEEGLSLSTIKQLSNAENKHCQIKWNKWWNKCNYGKEDRKIFFFNASLSGIWITRSLRRFFY